MCPHRDPVHRMNRGDHEIASIQDPWPALAVGHRIGGCAQIRGSPMPSPRFIASSKQNLCERARCGPGLPGAIVDQLFEPFFTTKAEGTGMGLAIARSIVEAHGGTLAGENCEDGGALFTISLPGATEAKLQAA
jgi:histidine kinase/DNA gyrase B/HSP90-like ATPase